MCIFDQNINMTETINLHKYFYYAFGSCNTQITKVESFLIDPILEVIQLT